jgi:hypothetical protein
MLLVMGAVAAVVAMGPLLRAFGHELGPGPWALLRELIPVFEKIRVTSRAGIFLALPLAMLASKGVTLLRLRPAVVTVVGVLGLAETLIAPIPMPGWTKVVDTREEPPLVYRWLAEETDGEPIVHLPMFDGRYLWRRPGFHESVYMLYSTLHWNPMVNGYAGIEPEHYLRIRGQMMTFPAETFLDLLREIEIRYVILHRDGYGPLQRQRLESQMAELRPGSLRELAAFGDTTVFELLSPDPGGRTSRWEPGLNDTANSSSGFSEDELRMTEGTGSERPNGPPPGSE